MIQKITILLETWAEKLINIAPKLIIATAILVIAVLVSRIGGKLAEKIFNKFSKNIAVNRLLGSLVGVFIVLIGILIGLNVLGFSTALTSILAGAGIAGIAIGFAFQELAANLIAGITVAFQKPFNVGDLIKVQDYFGTVQRINLRMTEIKTLGGKIVYIPNKLVISDALTDYTRLGRTRIELNVGVSYGEDLEKVKDVTLAAIEDIDNVLKDESIDVYFEKFGDSSVNYTVRFWVPFKTYPDFLTARDNAIVNIHKAYRKNDITIPFPIRTLDFGIKGGTRFDELNGK